jgi:monolysocardiolipin acyltransferase
MICEIQGFEEIMSEDRKFPRFIPRVWGSKLTIVFGSPITSVVSPLIQKYRQSLTLSSPSPSPSTSTSVASASNEFFTPFDPENPRPGPPNYEADDPDAKRVRMEIAEVLRDELQKLGRQSRSVIA